MVMSKVKYEELRQQRMEENKRKLEELHLPLLSQALRKASSPKPSPMKKVKPRIIRTELVPVRRSDRFANKPAPHYKEVIFYERVQLPRRISYPKRDLSNRVYASDEARESAIEKAEKLESNLEGDLPSLIKSMLQSHVTGGFWLVQSSSIPFDSCETKSFNLLHISLTMTRKLKRMMQGLPSHFCKRHLPRRDDTVTLIDEQGDEWRTVYLARKTGLSGGWKKFAVDHDLVDGDALVFHLIQPTVFKVYIIRVNSSVEENVTEASNDSS